MSDTEHMELRREMRAEIERLQARLVESDRIADGYYRLLREASDKNERLRSYIWSLDGKHIGISADNGATFIDDGIIVATDILGSDHEQKVDSDG